MTVFHNVHQNKCQTGRCCYLAPTSCQTKMFPRRSIFSQRLKVTPVYLSILCPGLGVLGDGDQAGGSESAGPGLPPRGAALHGDPPQQRAPGPEERPHEGPAQLHPGSHRPGAAAVCSQRCNLFSMTYRRMNTTQGWRRNIFN